MIDNKLSLLKTPDICSVCLIADDQPLYGHCFEGRLVHPTHFECTRKDGNTKCWTCFQQLDLPPLTYYESICNTCNNVYTGLRTSIWKAFNAPWEYLNSTYSYESFHYIGDSGN